MPLGLFIMIGVSVVVLRRARAVGRNWFLWVILYWVISLGIGFVGAFANGIRALLEDPENVNDEELKSAALICLIAGIVIWSIVTVWASGRPLANTAALEGSPDSRKGGTP